MRAGVELLLHSVLNRLRAAKDLFDSIFPALHFSYLVFLASSLRLHFHFPPVYLVFACSPLSILLHSISLPSLYFLDDCDQLARRLAPTGKKRGARFWLKITVWGNISKHVTGNPLPHLLAALKRARLNLNGCKLTHHVIRQIQMGMIVLSKKAQTFFFSAIHTLSLLCLSEKGGALRGRNGNGKKAASHFESKWLGRSLIAVSCSICWSGFNHIPLYDCTHKILIDFPFSLSFDVSFHQ